MKWAYIYLQDNCRRQSLINDIGSLNSLVEIRYEVCAASLGHCLKYIWSCQLVRASADVLLYPFGLPSSLHCCVNIKDSVSCKLYIRITVVWSEVKVAQSCPTLCDPVDCSLPGSSVHGILQTRMEWVTVPFSRGYSRPRDQTQVSYIAGRFFTIWV